MIDFYIGLFALVGTITIATLLAFLINAFKDGRRDEYEQDNEYETEYADQTWDTSVQMTDILTEALDVYDMSNIRIPKDIIEDAAIHQFDTVERAIYYIENQRNYWKLENQKKVLK